MPATTPVRFIHSPQRRWLDFLVGTVLISMLGFGSYYIFHLNNDARERELGSVMAMRGQEISTNEGCIACHTIDGSLGIGPSWQAMWGRTETLATGTTVLVDEEYFRKSLQAPQQQVVQGYPNVMSRYFLDDEEIEALIAFAKSLAAEPQP